MIDVNDIADEAVRPERLKRFYQLATVEPVGGGHAVRLDGRSVRTPARTELVVPAEAIAARLAEEWNAQGDLIEPATMPLTRLVNSGLDGVADKRDEVARDVARFAMTDLLFYRAASPRALAERQAETWDPFVAHVEAETGLALVRTEGVMPVEQPPALGEAVHAKAAALDPLALTALHVMTSLTGSAILALAHFEARADLDAVWAAAHVDEDWNIEQWGEDTFAAKRRRDRRADMLAASFLAASLEGGTAG